MSLNVVYNGSASTLLTSDIVIVKRKPGIMTEKDISDYLHSYSNADIKEGILRPGYSNNTYLYDLNDNKVMDYDLLLYVREKVTYGSSLLNTFECVGYIELPRMGLASIETHEVIKIKYTIQKAIIYGNVLTYNYDKSKFDISNYIVNSVSSNSLSLSRSAIDDIKFNHKLSTSMEVKGDSISPALSGYIYNNEYFESPTIDLDLAYGANSITKIEIRKYNNISWLEIRYSNNEIILHNLSLFPKVVQPLVSVVDGINTIKIVLPSYVDIVITKSNVVYRNRVGQWIMSDPKYTPTEMLSANNSLILKGDYLPGYKVKDNNCHIVYSDVSTLGNKNWCSDKEIMDRLYSINVTDSNNQSRTDSSWENSTLSHYRLMYADDYYIIVNKFNGNSNLMEVYFMDKTKYTFNGSFQFRALDKGDLMIRTSDTNFVLLSNSALHPKTITNSYDLAISYFSSFNSLVKDPPDLPTTFDNTIIYGGKFYQLKPNKKLN